MIDLRNPEHAYFFGYAIADGHLSEESRNRGKLTIEIQHRDRYILERFAQLFPVDSTLTCRKRDTNFKANYESAVWRVYDQAFRQELVDLGFKRGKKSFDVQIPRVVMSGPDFFRGLIDADGALGMISAGFPYLSLVTASEDVAQGFLAFLRSITGKTKTCSRNRRDGVFNIVVFKEDAQEVARVLYAQPCLALPRKVESAESLLQWIRPADMKRIIGRRRWTPQEDEFILQTDAMSASRVLGRTPQSITMRLWRLHKG